MEIDLEQTKQYLIKSGTIIEPETVNIAIPDARHMIKRGLETFIKGEPVWLPEYEDVADWLTNNEGRGLLLIGNCGRGKSVLAKKIIPTLISYFHRKIVSVYTSTQMNQRPDEVLSKHIVCVDDIGTEGESMLYGNRRMVLAELADAAEIEGKLLLLTTNMSVDELRHKYGERTIDRLRVITKPVLFNGESLRK